MKTKFTIMLTALLMLFCMSANAQEAFPEGDVNHDGVVDNADIEEVIKIIVGTSTLDNPNVVGDVSGDGFVNVVDIVKIVNIMNTPVGNPVITFSVNIINNTGSDVTLDGDVRFILGNPDHNGYELGWNGSFNETDRIRFSKEAVTIKAGESMKFDGLTWMDEETKMGMGEKSPANADQLVAAERPKNVLVYVNDNSEIVVCDNMPTDIVFQEGGVYDIKLASSSATPTPPPTNGNPVITIGVRITNNSGAAVTLDGDLKFTLGNPDKNGNYFGWEGPYTGTPHLRFSDSAVTLGAGETRTFTLEKWEDEELHQGLGGKSPADADQLAAAERPRNVLLYVGGNSEIVMCDNMSPSIVFEDGGTYDINISSAGTTPTPPPTNGNPVITIGVRITNNSGAAVTLDGDLKFTLGNPDKNGNYFGWNGPYTGTPHLRFSDSAVTLGAGETRTFTLEKWEDDELHQGLGGKSPADADQLAAAERPRNVLLYVGGNSEIVMCDNMSPSIVFEDGGIYDINISGAGTTPTPTPTPTNGNPVITIGVRITNNSGAAVTLDGDLKFTLGNPDKNGNYFGWSGPYTGTPHLRFSNSAVTLGAGETRTFTLERWEDDELHQGLGGKSPADASQLAAAERPRNVLLYVGGNSEIVMCDNMSPSIVFEDGGTYDINISGSGSGGSTPVVSGNGNPVITIGVRITNAHGSAVTLDGDLKFTLGNPDHHGNYFGWYGPYTGTPHLRFSNSAVTLGAGETRTFYGLTWRDDEIGWGLGGKSPADADQLAASERPRNVVLYIGGNSEIVLCDNMSPSIEFEEGGVYDIVIR